MLTGQLRSQVDRIWDAFWSGGISNPLEVIEQITYLLFLRRLDDLETLEENKAARLGEPMTRRFYPAGKDALSRDYQLLRWSRFKNEAPAEMFAIVRDSVFPFLRTLGANDSTYAHHMKDARFTIPTPGLLAKVVDLLDDVPMTDRDTKGDLYEYMLGKIATAGQNGQFRTPRHIIQLMVEMTAPTPTDRICDPACGTAGFLVAAGEYLRREYPNLLHDAKQRAHFHEDLFHGFDFDNTMLRIGSMNMLLHGVENPDIRYRDSLAEEHAADAESYSLVLANPPFAGSLDYEGVAKDLLAIVKTKKTELLFLALFLRLLKPGGRAAVVVPTGVLEGDSEAHRAIRRALIEENRLEAVVLLPHWVFKPYASVATAIVIFGKSGQTGSVLFYRVENDGYQNDAVKSPRPGSELPELLDLWNHRVVKPVEPRPGKARMVSRSEIVNNDYDLCDRVYLSGYSYPDGSHLVSLDKLFLIAKGNAGAADAAEGPYPLITSSEEPRTYPSYSFEGEAICIPLVSSTGHGHASIKRIHYVSGKFEAATITAVLQPRPNVDFDVLYVYHYLLAHKDEVLVPLMRGAANVSLSVERLRRLRVPLPGPEEQRRLVAPLKLASLQVAERREQLAEAIDRTREALDAFRSST